MYKPLLLLPAVLFLVPALSPVPQKAPAGQKPTAASAETPKPDSMARVKEIYGFDCAICHGAAGDGKTDLGKDMGVVDWTDPKILANKTDDQLFEIIRKGKDKMPAEDSSRAKDDEIKGLIKYIHELQKAGPAATPAAAPSSSPTTN